MILNTQYTSRHCEGERSEPEAISPFQHFHCERGEALSSLFSRLLLRLRLIAMTFLIPLLSGARGVSSTKANRHSPLIDRFLHARVLTLVTVVFTIYYSLFTNYLFAQQLSQYTQYTLNNYLLNPAVAGARPCTDVKTGYRTQWVGFESQPKDMFLSLYTPLKFKNKPMMKQKHAVGGYVERDQTGPSSRTAVYFSYSIHTPISRSYNLGAGIFGGFMQYAFNTSQLFTASGSDATISGAGNKFIVPDFNPGIWLYSNNHYLGFSVKSILGNKFTQKSRLTRHMYFTTGYKITTAGPWAFLPSTFVRFSPTSPFGIDLTLMADYANKIAIGASYRTTDGIAGIIKFTIKNLIIGYSYDYNLSKIRLASSNAHEVILGLKFCPSTGYGSGQGKSGDNPNTNRCPAYN